MDSPEPATHPCERVFGSCKSGDQCHYKDAPREACVSFLKGKCRFGNACRESHFINHEGKYISAFHPCLRVFSDCKFGEKCEYAQLPSTSCIKFLKGKCTFGTRCAEQHFGMFPGFGGAQMPFAMTPLQMQQQAHMMQTHMQQQQARGGGGGRRQVGGGGGGGGGHVRASSSSSSSVPSSSSSSLLPSSSSSTSPSSTTNSTVPTNNNNNKDATSANNNSGSGNNNNNNNNHNNHNTHGNSNSNNSSASGNPTMVLVPSKKQQQVSGQIHPCVRVFGACIAGPTCKFATIPAEACLRHLKGTCKFGDECAEIHFDTPDTPGGKHPCARIFGACQSSCRFAEYPRECCLQFLKGKCKFGDQCREVHLQSEQPKE